MYDHMLDLMVTILVVYSMFGYLLADDDFEAVIYM